MRIPIAVRSVSILCVHSEKFLLYRIRVHYGNRLQHAAVCVCICCMFVRVRMCLHNAACVFPYVSWLVGFVYLKMLCLFACLCLYMCVECACASVSVWRVS